MATVTLRAPLKDLAGGQTDVEVPGETVGEVIRGLEAQHPKLRGWILDEQGRVRQHVNVFVNGERMAEHAGVGPADRLHVLASISGGCAS
jgi:molybdopterin converting factor small subunit